MRAAFRVDASEKIGTGHVMRCMTLAHQFKGKGVDCVFYCRDLKGNLLELLKQNFSVQVLKETKVPQKKSKLSHSHWLETDFEEDAREFLALLKTERKFEFLVVDHYALDEHWEDLVRPAFGKIVVIDDLADRAHAADLLIDQNFVDDLEHRYDALVPEKCVKLLGPSYALLRAEFAELKSQARVYPKKPKNILLFMGGVDEKNTSKKILYLLESMKVDARIELIIGPSNPWRNELEQYAQSRENISTLFAPKNLAERMQACDVSISAGGATTWERCCLGTPSLTLAVAENQIPFTKYLDEKKIHFYLGTAEEIGTEAFEKKFTDLFSKYDELVLRAKRGMNLVDGLGASRVCARVLELK